VVLDVTDVDTIPAAAKTVPELDAPAGGDPAEAAAGAIRLPLLPDDGPTGQLFSWDGTPAPW
jgi:hypothetical protein